MNFFKSAKKLFPWYLKILSKLVLSRLPLGYHFWKRLDLFAHGAMNKPHYAYSVFLHHFKRSYFGRKNDKYVSLELGPGDSLHSAFVATAFGSSKCYLVDSASFATKDIDPYLEMEAFLRSKHLSVQTIANSADLEGALLSCNAVYLTNGLCSLKKIPPASVDFIWSQAVLEHIRRDEFLETVRELRRILRSDGVCSHRVDLKDHLGGALNNLRIPTRLWESDLFANSGFYTNRLRYSEILNLFQLGGFCVEIVSVNRWNSLPTSRRLFAREFQSFSDQDLLVQSFDVLLHPA